MFQLICTSYLKGGFRMFYRFMCSCSVLFFICVINVEATNNSDLVLIYKDSVDVTGDGEKETIHIEGERLSSSSTYFPFIHATIYSKNGDKWTIDLPGGFNPSFEYIDITNNGTNELLYQSSFNPEEDTHIFNIYTFENNHFSSIPIPVESFIHGKFIENFLVHIFIHPHEDPVVIDIKDQSSAYIAAGIYQQDGNLVRQQEVFIEPVHAIKGLPSEGQTMIETSQHASSMIDAKELGTIQSKWVFENDSWLLVDTSWKSSH